MTLEVKCIYNGKKYEFNSPNIIKQVLSRWPHFGPVSCLRNLIVRINQSQPYVAHIKE